MLVEFFTKIAIGSSILVAWVKARLRRKRRVPHQAIKEILRRAIQNAAAPQAKKQISGKQSFSLSYEKVPVGWHMSWSEQWLYGNATNGNRISTLNWVRRLGNQIVRVLGRVYRTIVRRIYIFQAFYMIPMAVCNQNALEFFTTLEQKTYNRLCFGDINTKTGVPLLNDVGKIIFQAGNGVNCNHEENLASCLGSDNALERVS